MRTREPEERPWQRPPRRMRDAEIRREACADELGGFRSACSTLEKFREEPGDYLCSGFGVSFFLLAFSVKMRSGVSANVPQLSQDYRLLTPIMSSEGVSPIPQTCFRFPY